MIKTPIETKEQIVTSLKVNPELWKEAKIEALKCDITLSELIDQAIREWIEKRKQTQNKADQIANKYAKNKG